MNSEIEALNNYPKFVPLNKDWFKVEMIKKMQTMKFKTNINCSGCVAKVTNTLNEAVGKENWKVDTSIPEKILTVNAEYISSEEIEEAVKSAGFRIEEL